MDLFLPDVEKGLKVAGRKLDELDIAPNVPVAIDDDQSQAYDWARPLYGLYIGGMGSRKNNFYFNLASRYGFEEAAEGVQDKFLEGDRFGAYQAVPEGLIDATALVGPVDRIRERVARYEDAGVTTMILNPMAGTLEDRIDILRRMMEIVN
jgi:alkanesulfonate monooxygenase SsuD/methylene tetrahydromethanopterin reductase-like flavin-dependent oxidoreductase (luciferase family)